MFWGVLGGVLGRPGVDLGGRRLPGEPGTRMLGLGLRVEGFGFRVSGSGFPTLSPRTRSSPTLSPSNSEPLKF